MNTIPDANLLVRDLRDLSTTLSEFSQRMNEKGVGGVLGEPKLPDSKPKDGR